MNDPVIKYRQQKKRSMQQAPEIETLSNFYSTMLTWGFQKPIHELVHFSIDSEPVFLKRTRIFKDDLNPCKSYMK